MLIYFSFHQNNPFKATFFFSAKFLVYVVFVVTNNSAVSVWLSIAANQNEFFLLGIMSGSDRLLVSRLIFLRSMR